MKGDNATNTQGQFLLAMPHLNCSFFAGCLVYMLEHNEEGAIGLVVNQTTELTVDDILEQVDTNYEGHHSEKIYTGGPVQPERGFVLHKPSDTPWDNQTNMTDNFAVTVSADILEALAQGKNVGEYMIVLGYSGWAPDQLEQELADNAWLTVDTDPATIMQIHPDKRMHAVAATLGIDYDQLSGDSGHA